MVIFAGSAVVSAATFVGCVTRLSAVWLRGHSGASASTTGMSSTLPYRYISPLSCCRHSPFFVNALHLQLGAMPRLNRMLASPMLHIKQHSALSLSFLCSTNSAAQLAAADAGALSAVQELLHSNRTQIVVTGLRFIFNLACVAIRVHATKLLATHQLAGTTTPGRRRNSCSWVL